LEPLPQVLKKCQILGHDKNPARLFAHVEQALHFIGRRTLKKSEKQRGQIRLIGRSPLYP
jgi:hypothetical protein